MEFKHVDRVYCSNCRKNLHNTYKYLGDKKVKLVKRRCKGEKLEIEVGVKDSGRVIKCECPCQTHFIHFGKKVRIGDEPPPLPPLFESEQIPNPKLDKLLASFKSPEKKPVPISSILGTMDEKAKVVKKDSDVSVAGGYTFLDSFEKDKSYRYRGGKRVR